MLDKHILSVDNQYPNTIFHFFKKFADSQYSNNFKKFRI
jgi:hypothetical protein